MKRIIPLFVKTLILILVLLLPTRQLAQLSINLSSVTCNSLTASANTGTFTANTLNWSILPVGPIIYSPSAQSTIIRFPQSGNFSLSILAQTSQGSAQISQSLSIIAMPSLTVSASPDTVCWTQSSTLSSGGAVNYSWAPTAFLSSFNNSVTLTTPLTSLIYTLTANNGLGCTNTNTVFVSFAFPPNTTIVATSTDVCIGQTATLIAFGASYYSWSGSSFTGTVANQTLVAGAGTYTVVGYIGDDCYKAATYSIIEVPCPNSIFELNSALGIIKLFPNPITGVFCISSAIGNLSRIVVVDAFGKIVLIQDKILPKTDVIEVDSRHLPNGFYFVEIALDDGSSRTLKLVKD